MFVALLAAMTAGGIYLNIDINILPRSVHKNFTIQNRLVRQWLQLEAIFLSI